MLVLRTSVPGTFPALVRLRLLVALTLLLASVAGWAKGPEPERLALGPLGFQAPGPGALASGGVTSTVHFIDEQHLLVTFSVRRLMKRMPDCPKEDVDRMIEAVVVHLPSGKVLARTTWRLHDGSQYLWSLGHGRFLLRVRDTLTTFVPLANLAKGEAFAEQPFLKSSRRVAVLLFSPERDLLTVETVERPDPATGDAAAGDAEAQGPPRHAQLNFYRLLQPAEPGERMVAQVAGAGRTDGLVSLSLTAAGWVEVLQESATRWLFDFDPYGGKYVELSPFDSSCRPHPIFVSGSEFVAFGCRGSNDRLAMGGFNMRGEQMWQQNFTDAHAYPSFAFAPAAGRFALSRNIVASTAGITVDFAPTAFTTQEIRVIQTYSGKQLLRVEASPVQRSGQNYDLSPDGLRLAVIRGEAVEVHRLPRLTEADEAGVRAARAVAPKDAGAMVTLVSHVQPGAGKAPSKMAVVASAAAVAAPAKAEVFTPMVAPAPEASGVAAEEPRKKPTLYTLPTDKPEKPQE